MRNQQAGIKVPLHSYTRLQQPRAADEGVLLRLLCGLSYRDYRAAAEAVPEAFGLSRSSVSRRYIRATARKLAALLLVRIVERRTDQRWSQVRRTLQRMHLGEFAGPEDAVHQRTEITSDQHHLFTTLRLPEPPRIFAITPVRGRARAR